MSISAECFMIKTVVQNTWIMINKNGSLFILLAILMNEKKNIYFSSQVIFNCRENLKLNYITVKLRLMNNFFLLNSNLKLFILNVKYNLF